jgi:hypothetical protein
MSPKIRKEFIMFLNNLIGKKCWKAQGKIGSWIGLSFGRKIPINLELREKIRKERFKHNPELLKILPQHKFKPEFYLALHEAAWRLENDKKVITGSTASNHLGGPRELGLKMLLGKHVIDINVDEVSLDLTITFNNRLKFKIFCDQLNEVDDMVLNYSMSNRALKKGFCVAPKSSVVRMKGKW